MARPTKLQVRHIELLDDYVSECGDTYDEFSKSSSEGMTTTSESHGYRLKVKLPTLCGLQLYFSKASKSEKNKNLRINESTIKDWRTKGDELSSQEIIDEKDEIFVEFSTSLNDLLKLQEEMLLNGGVSNQYGQVITKLMLSSNHGYKEKSEVDNKHSGSVAVIEMTDAQKEKIAKRLLNK